MDTPQLLPYERLDQYILERADELGMRLKDVADYLDVSEPTLVGWRYGTQRPTLRYAQRLDDFMGWQKAPSSTLAVLNGDEPVKVRDEPRRPEGAKRPDPLGTTKSALPEEVASVIEEIKSLENLRPEQQDVLIEHLLSTIRSTREQAARWNEEQAG